MKLIEFDNVGFSYSIDEEENMASKIEVLKNLSFDIEKGSFVAVLGHNGSENQRLRSL